MQLSFIWNALRNESLLKTGNFIYFHEQRRADSSPIHFYQVKSKLPWNCSSINPLQQVVKFLKSREDFAL